MGNDFTDDGICHYSYNYMMSEYKIAIYVREKIAILSGINKAENGFADCKIAVDFV
ncbi:hypothetical protein GCM10011500_35120 [Mucilaginibacter rubeus]|nr:hypothetical protein GCM10011500_35120 [Mucilaginibacter rubeus]